MSSSWLGALLVLAGSTALGNQFALTFRRRPRDLAHCQLCLQVLLTEIDYGLTPLPQALQRAAGAAQGPIAAVFAATATQLSAEPGCTPRQAWLQAWSSAAGHALSTADLEVLAGLAPSLGASDRHHQRRHLLLCTQRLAAAEAEARAGAEQNLRMYRYLGVLAGAFLAALLV